jgi:hypothetical protein
MASVGSMLGYFAIGGHLIAKYIIQPNFYSDKKCLFSLKSLADESESRVKFQQGLKENVDVRLDTIKRFFEEDFKTQNNEMRVK